MKRTLENTVLDYSIFIARDYEPEFRASAQAGSPAGSAAGAPKSRPTSGRAETSSNRRNMTAHVFTWSGKL